MIPSLFLLTTDADAAVRAVPAQYATVGDAVRAASSGDVVLISAGTWTEPTPVTIDRSITLRGAGGAVVLRGGDEATGLFDVDEGVTVSIEDLEFDGQGSLPALRVSDGDVSMLRVVIHDTASSVRSGGAIAVGARIGNSLAMSSCRIERSSVTGSNEGGAIHLAAGSVTLLQTVLSTGSSAADGGLISQLTGTLELTASVLEHGTAQRGGAIVINGGNLLAHTVRFEGNTSAASRGGGAIYDEGATSMLVEDSVLVGNRSLGNEGGGAIYHRGTTGGVYVRDVFCNNTAAADGGAFRIHSGSASISASVFLDNRSTGGDGGAIAVVGGTLDVRHVSVATGDATRGHGLFSAGAAAITDSYFGDHPVGAYAVRASQSGDASVATSGWWHNLGGDFDANTDDGGGNTFGDPNLPVPVADTCDVAALIPLDGGALVGAASGGDDIGAFDGPDTWGDTDGDGVPDPFDCEPDDATIHPRAVDIPGNGVDEDCDGYDADPGHTGHTGDPGTHTGLDTGDTGGAGDHTGLGTHSGSGGDTGVADTADPEPTDPSAVRVTPSPNGDPGCGCGSAPTSAGSWSGLAALLAAATSRARGGRRGCGRRSRRA